MQEVVEHSPQLLPKVQRALLPGNFIPGDIRRVWIAKPGGGKREKSSVNGPYGLTFLGFQLSKVERSGEVTIAVSKRTRLRMNVKVRELTPRNWGNSFERCVARLNAYLHGWMGTFQLCTDTTSFSRFDAHIRRRLRAILIRQRKRPRHLLRHLLGRGVSGGLAGKAVYGIRGYWKRSASFAIHKAYPNAWFVNQRLVNLYRRRHVLNPPQAWKQLLLFGDT